MEETIVLYNSYDAALAARKAFADEAAGRTSAPALPWFAETRTRGGSALGCEVTTPEALLADTWELWGDSRAIVTAAQRRLLMALLLRDHSRFPSSSASIRSFAQFVAYRSGEPLFERILAADERERRELYGLDGVEEEVFALVFAYRQRLAGMSLIEAGCAAASSDPSHLGGRLLIAERLDAVPALTRFLYDAGGEVVGDAANVIEADPAQKSFFSFPAGAGIAWQAVHRLIAEDMREEASIAVGTADPLALYAVLAPMLLRDGREVGLRCSVAFDRTAFGRAVAAVEELMDDGAHAVQEATDFMHGAFSGVSASDAQRFDARLRADRSLDGRAIRDLLRQASPSFGVLEDLIESDGPLSADAIDILQGALERTSGLTMGSHVAEEGMLEAFLALREDALAQGADRRTISELARGLSVPLSLATPGYDPQGRCVRFFDAASLGRAPAASFDGTILDGLTDAEVDASSERSSLDALAARLGLAARPSRTEELRAGFEGARRAARRSFACVMPLRDSAFEPTYPAFTLDEYVSAYAAVRGWDDAPRDDELFLFPKPLTQRAHRSGEDDLVASVGACIDPVAEVEELDGAMRGHLRSVRLLDRLKTVTEGDEVLPVLSPSAIESYLMCPYRWFVTRRLRLNELDETFSAREMGLFAHRAYAQLYERLAGEGAHRLDLASLDRARALLDEVMDDILIEYEATRGCAFEGERLLAVAPREEVEVARLREALRCSLDPLARLPEGYEVMGHEVVIAPEDGVDFAGARLNGRIDRVDVSPQTGRFAIIDYKGSLHGHSAGFSGKDDIESFELPSKVQALIYALGFQRLHDGLSAAAALYASYRAKDGAELLAGSFDPLAYDASCSARSASVVEMSFASFLAMVEQRTAPFIEALKHGDIAPAPRTKDACAWCPYLGCERRR